MSTDLFLKEVEKYAELEGQAIVVGDEESCKVAKCRLHNLLSEIGNNESLKNIVIENMLVSIKPNVKLWGCDLALSNDYDKIKVKGILQEISNTPKIGILALRAEVYLRKMV